MFEKSAILAAVKAFGSQVKSNASDAAKKLLESQGYTITTKKTSNK